MQEIWLPPNTPNSKASGKFVDHVDTYTDKHGEKKSRTVVLLLTRIPGSNDVSSQLVKDNADGEKLKREYSKAWEYYQKNKADPEPEPVPTATEFGLKGTPIEEVDFIGKDRLAALKMAGFLTVEQLADMSDTVCNNMGFGARAWRKKAAEFLIVKRDAQPAAIGPSVADLMAQLAEANAKIALLAEAVLAKPAEAAVEAQEGAPIIGTPKRRGRPPKTAEAQPQA